MRNKLLLIIALCIIGFIRYQVKIAEAQPVNEASVAEVVDEAEVVEVSKSLDLSAIIEKIPAWKQGIFYNAVDNDVNYVSTVEVSRYKDFALEFGYSPNITALAIVSYPIVKLKDYGVDIPILDLIELNVGVAAGLRRIQLREPEGGNEFVFGVSATLINIKF